MKVSAYHTEDVFEKLQPEWNDLLRRSTFDNIFTTWEWQSNWWAAYQPGKLWVIVVRNHEDRLLGIAPLFIDHTPEGERVVREIGCVDVTDYLDLLVHKECTGPVLDCIAGVLAENRDSFDRINLCNLPPESATYQYFSQALERHGLTTEFEQQEVCPFITLPDDWESYLALLDKKQRHELRRKLRIAHGQPGIDWYIVGGEHNLDEQLELFLKLMAQSTPDKAAFLSDPKNEHFFRRVMPLIAANGWLQLSFLTSNGEAIAAYLNFDYNKRVLVYNSGLSLTHGSISPGIVLLAHNVRYAVENGFEEFDFLRGNEEYKYRMGGIDRPVFMLKAH